MKIPLAYPKIPDSSANHQGRCIAFEKYDGTNIHWVWSPEIGWHAFGCRRTRFDFDEHGIRQFNRHHKGLLRDAPGVFQEGLAPLLEAIFQSGRAQVDTNGGDVVVFTEYLGPRSFAGKHKATDPKELRLFDVLTPRGMVPPEEFVEIYNSAYTARMVYKGKFTAQLKADVRANRYKTPEGVVVKGLDPTDPWMLKIKTDAYQARLKQALGDDWERYWE